MTTAARPNCGPNADPAHPRTTPAYTPRAVRPDGELARLAELFRRGSAMTEPSELLSHFGVWFNRNPVGELLVSISRRNMPEGHYKITRRMTRAQRITLHQRGSVDLDQASGDGSSNPWRDWTKLPAQTGGLLAAVTSGDAPASFSDIDLEGDPQLGTHAGALRSCIAIPTFDNGEPINWAVFFFESPEPPPEDDFAQLVLQISFLGLATKNLVVRKEIQTLNEQLRGQFQKIASIQKSLLPERTPAIPGFRIATSYLTSEEAGGDYYDFFPFPRGRWGILIADVSGHGPAAATVMAMLRAILHCYEADTTTPDEVMRYANQKLAGSKLDGSFVTAFFAILDPKTGEFSWVRCGHNPPRIRRANGEIVELGDAGSLPLGIVDDLPAESASIKIDERDTIILYTDGITEAMNRTREMFGPERLDASLEHCSGAPECVIDHIYAALHKFTGTMRRDDDQTIVALQRVDHSNVCPLPEGLAVRRDIAELGGHP